MNLLHGDCLELMRDIPDSSIDLVLTDPPYKISSGGRTNKEYIGTIIDKNDGRIFKHNDTNIKDWAPECFRVLKESSHFYIMTNNINLREYLNVCHNVGFKFHNMLLWKKNNNSANRWYMKCTEYILFFRKGKAKTINNPSSNQLIELNILRNRIHPTQKPVKLMSYMVENSSLPRDIVLDPFMGVGSTGVACKNLNRKFIGIEMDDNYFGIAKQRIENTPHPR